MPIRKKLFLGIFILALCIGIGASTYKLTESPAIWYDEGFYSQMAMNVLSDHTQAIQIAPKTFDYEHSRYVTVGYPLVYPLSLSYKLFGVSVLSGRAVMVVFILLSIIAAAGMVYLLFGFETAALSSVLLATFPMLYGNGKSILGEVPGLFFLMVSLASFEYLERSGYKSKWAMVNLGVFTALCIVTKPLFLLLLGAYGVIVLAQVRGIFPKLTVRAVAIGIVAFLVPLLWWVHTQTENSSPSSLLAHYANPYGAGADPWSFVPGNIKRFFTDVTPFYTLLLMGAWALSLMLRWRKRAIVRAESVAFVFCVLVILSYLRMHGWYRYLFPATFVAMVFLPSSLIVLADVVKRKKKSFAPVVWVPYLVVAFLAVGQLYQTAHKSFVADYYTSTKTRDLTEYFDSLPASATFFLYEAPEVAILLPSQKYYQYLIPLPGIEFGRNILGVLTEGKVEYVIVPDRMYPQNKETLFAKYTLLKNVQKYNILVRRR